MDKPIQNNESTPRSLAIAAEGVKTAKDFASLMSALMSDIIEQRIDPNIANAAVKAGQTMLKVIDMQIKYGEQGKNGKKSLQLIENSDEPK